MIKRKKTSNILKNQRGVLTLDFIFGFVLVFGFTMTIFFSLVLTLSVAEIVQYMTFSSARSYFAGHHNEVAQKQAGLDKFEELKKDSVLNPLFSNGWFELKNVEVRSFVDEFSFEDPDKNTFAGTRVLFKASMLDFNIPFLGDSTGDELNPFESKISTYLGREPTSSECMNFNYQRMQMIINLGYGGSTFDPNRYLPYSDDGC